MFVEDLKAIIDIQMSTIYDTVIRINKKVENSIGLKRYTNRKNGRI